MGLRKDIAGTVTSGLATLAMFVGAPTVALLVGMTEIEQEYVVRDVESAAVWLPVEAPEVEPLSEEVLTVTDTDGEAEVHVAASSDEGPGTAAAPVETARDGRVATAQPGKVRPKKRKRRRCAPDPIEEIRHHGATMWTVERSIIKHYTRSLKRINSLGWSKQHEGSDGRPDGMAIYGVKCNNDLHRAGIRSGDVVHSVNGHRVRNIPQAIAAYLAVRNDRVVKVDLTRRGERKVFAYRLAG